MHVYDQVFYNQMEGGARCSARNAIAVLKQNLSISSVLDVGAGRGGWLAEWILSGTTDVVGVDGDYVNRDQLLIPQTSFIAHNLQTSLNLNRQFDLVESLEVAEHIDRRNAEGFIDLLTSHGKVILFSAATPGQGGEYHVNEQPLDYWRKKFIARGYRAFDPLRPQLRNRADVEPWYRYNMILYVHESVVSELPQSIVGTAVGNAIADYRPAGYRFKAFFMSFLPVSLSTRWAMFKDRVRRHRYSIAAR